ncbi:hypothetical protein HYH03_011233 [Edaphochlamys debaryana]|uniref:Uncharacterized protein n=1 Tax=Edaphochlamys debaryana TaxID=47281 RepID=A0A835XXM6_9CHLO|nr:hypothetical protein HYH03_011233 [Edaphochlamys debaryana]|eukprot:KAG2490281.1 hypothetical protein HYH03_011233 [Edaphochlamys debaryana]
MTDAAAPPSAPVHQPFSLGDLLSSNLPTCARRALHSRLAIYGLSCIRNARLACRGLRQLIDEQIPGVCLHLDTFSPGDLAAFGADGRWLQRRPAVSKVTLVASEAVAAECIALPFGGASQQACLRVKELAVRIGYPSQHSSGAALFALLSRLPALTALTLNNLFLREGPAHATLATCALDSLPQLTSLTLGCSRLAGCIGPSLAARLTHFELDTGSSSDSSPGQVAVARALIPRLTAVRDLKLDVECHHPFTPVDLRVMLDALPASAQNLSVRWLLLTNADPEADFELVCRFAHGALTAVEVRQDEYGPVSDVMYEGISNLLATALLPSRVLGPRLPLLHLDLQLTVTVDAIPPDPHPATAFLERCDRLRLRSLSWEEEASADAVFAVVQRLVTPGNLSMYAALEGDVQLDDGETAWAVRMLSSPLIPPASLGNLCALPPWQAVPAVVRLALQTFSTGGPVLVLSGPALQPLLGCQPALRAWVETVAQRAQYQLPDADAGSEAPHTGPLVSGYQALPYGAGVLLVDCCTKAAAGAVAAAAYGTITMGGGGGGAGRAQLQATQMSGHFGYSVAHVLQSAWYACRAGGRGGGAAGSGSGAVSGGTAGSGGGMVGTGGGAGSSQGEDKLQLLRWLLEVWEGLRKGAVQLKA